jgi:hypothetical protein
MGLIKPRMLPAADILGATRRCTLGCTAGPDCASPAEARGLTVPVLDPSAREDEGGGGGGRESFPEPANCSAIQAQRQRASGHHTSNQPRHLLAPNAGGERGGVPRTRKATAQAGPTLPPP